MTSQLFFENLSLLKLLWQSTFFALIGLASVWFLRRRPARASQVLFLAMTAAVIVPVLSELVKHYELGIFKSVSIALPIQTHSDFSAYESPAILVSTESDGIIRIPVMREQILQRSSENIEQVSAYHIEWRSIILSGWLLMSVILLMRLIYSYISSIHMLRQAKSGNCERIRRAVDIAGKKLGITVNLQIRRSERVRSPVIWCWNTNPILLVSEKLDDNIDWNAVICHELAHFKRADHITGLIAEIIVCLLPWNPFLWLSKRIMIRLSEQACDDWVIATGQTPEDYAQSLLNFKPQRQVSFVPAVVHSKKGLSQRIRRILRENSFYPKTGTVWFITTCIIALCITIGVAFAQTRQVPASTWDLIRQAQSDRAEPTESPEPVGIERILHFPKARSLGQLMIGDENSKTDVPYPFEEIAWESFGSAHGDVKVPQGKIVRLILHSWTWQNPADLSVLKQLKPDDIYSLTLSPSWSSGGQLPNDKCLPYVLHLTGLKTLNLDGAEIAAKGLESLVGLKSLERLCMPTNVYNSEMAAVGKLKNLTLLRISEGNNITNTGLRQLENLKLLRILHVNSARMTDEGLKVLSELPHLHYLVLRGNFTDDAALYLKDVSSLRGLKIDTEQFGDIGMKNLAGLTQLENIDAHWMKGITDEGAAYLKDMTNLKKLDIGSSKVTDKGLSYLKECNKIETLILPGTGISDVGLTYIGNMSNLKHLRVSRVQYVNPARDVGYYTDKGVAELTKCKLLEDLIIGSSGMTDESLRYISELQNLKLLRVSGNGISDEGIKHIAKLTNLKELGVSNKLLTNRAIEELAPLQSLIGLDIEGDAISVSGLKFLNNLKNLKRLDIQKIKQDDSDIMDISGLTQLENLTLFLNVDMNYRDRSLSNVARFRDQDWACLEKLSKLRRLQITGFGITDNGMKYLSGLKNVEFISIQCLYETSITDEGLKYIVDLQQLNRLIIADGHFTDKALEYLSGMNALSWLELTSDFAFSSRAIQSFQRTNPNITTLRFIP